jgi:hypothetical protein
MYHILHLEKEKKDCLDFTLYPVGNKLEFQIYMTLNNSTSNLRVAPGGITSPLPASP